MNADDILWKEDGDRCGWVMPTAKWWKRLPVVRRIRAAWHGVHVYRHNALCARLGFLDTGYDKWVLYGIARGFERPGDNHD